MLLQSQKITTDALEKRLRSLSSLDDVEEIRLHNNVLQSPLPARIWSMPSLRVFVVDSNYIVSLDDMPLSPAAPLEKLSASWNMLTLLPPQICSLTHLTILSLHHNRLTRLPADFGHRLTNLRDLNLGHNSLIHLPDIRALRNLATFSLERNPDLPASIGLPFWIHSEIPEVINRASNYFARRDAIFIFVWHFFSESSPLPPEIVMVIVKMVWAYRDEFLSPMGAQFAQ